MKKHQGHVQKRTERVSKYFTPTTPTKPTSNNYALFSSTNTISAHSELRRRLPIVDVSGSAAPQQQQEQQQFQRRNNQHEQAQKIESSIAQVRLNILTIYGITE